MKTEISEAILRLDQHGNLTLGDSKSGCIHVHWGNLWVTRDGDARDYIVTSGESFPFDARGKTVLTAISDAGLSVMERCGSGEVPVRNELPLGTSAVQGRQFGDHLPEYETIDRHVHRAGQLRAHYIAAVIGRGWTALRRGLQSLG